ncbi:cyclic nucleotide-binding domain-containing protein [Ditylenchus destructor]|nr:cyclic nucleotide-binding domain-containing protein [Ditylenchus destructor]
MGNIISDVVNLGDMFIQSRKEYLHDGVYIKDPSLTTKRYASSTFFMLDIASIIPLDFVLLFQWPQMSLIRINRLAKIYRVRKFIRLTEIRTTFPHLFQVVRLTFICYAIFHWNGCVYFLLSTIYGMDDADVNDWIFTYSKIPDLVYSICDARFDNNMCLYNESQRHWQMRDHYVEDMMSYWENRTRSTNFSNLTKQYGLSFYWSALTLVTLGEQPWPNNSVEMSFEIFDTLLGLLLLAIVIGDIGIMVTQKNFAKMNYEKFIDGEVHLILQAKIINWFEYFWTQEQKGQAKVDERDIFEFLPPRLSKELAGEVHLETLRKECDENILFEFISNLQLQIYSPGDYICYEGEIGKEIYIVKRGELEVIDAEGQVCVTLGDGAVFGELSILRIPGNINGNRRTATVRSKGFVDLYVLTKRDLWRTVNDFPDAREMIIEKEVKSVTKTMDD